MIARPRWQDAPPQIVFEDEHLRVLFQPGASDVLLITFGDAGTLADGTRFFADSVARAYAINTLGFMAKAANWYPRASMQAARRELSFNLAAFDQRLAYGCSMGGYGAIKHSALLGCTHVVAQCPQWSIDPDECGAVESGYRNHFRPEMTGMSIRLAEINGEITIFYDPQQVSDAFHYDHLRRLSERVRGYRVPHAGHQVADVLKGLALAASIFSACITGQDDLYGVINPARRASFYRRRHLLSAAAVRHPVLAFHAAAQLVREGQLSVIDGPRCATRLLPALVECDKEDLARKLLALLSEGTDAARTAILREDAARAWKQLAQPLASLTTSHGTGLFYSAVGGCLTHLSEPATPPQHVGLRPVFVHESGVLVVQLGDEILACDGFNDHDTRLVPLSVDLPATCFRATMADGGVALAAAGLYASAHPGGLVWRTAPEILNWERFT